MVSRQQVQYRRWPHGDPEGVHEVSKRLHQGEMWLCAPLLVSLSIYDDFILFSVLRPVFFFFFFIKHKLFILLSEGIVFTAAGEVLLTWEEFAPWPKEEESTRWVSNHKSLITDFTEPSLSSTSLCNTSLLLIQKHIVIFNMSTLSIC